MRILEDFVFEHLAPHGIRHIAPVSLAMASGQVAEVYREMGRDFMLAPPLTVHSPIPELLAGVWAAARESLICRPAGRVAREAIAASVSRINDCPYCVDVHSMMLDGAGEHGLAAAAANHGVYGDVDAGIARIMAWAAATRTPDSPLLATPPFWAEDIPQMFGTAVMFHYINRITNVFLDKSPLPFPSGRSTKRIAGSLLASRIVKVSASPDQARRLPDTAQLPADFGWTASNRVVAGAFAQMAAAVESAGQAAVPLSVRKQLHERLREWRGADPGLSRAWVEAAVEDIDPSERAAARLVLLTAFASYQVDDGVIEAFRATGDGDARLVATVAWASFCAARKVAGWLLPQNAMPIPTRNANPS